MTYHELAEHRGISLASARKYAQKKRWKRHPGNDGLARIEVPLEAISAEPKPQVEDTPADTHDLTALDAQITALRELLASADRRADAEAGRADAEAKRADAAEHDRDAWKTQADDWKSQAEHMRAQSGQGIIKRLVAGLFR